MSTKPSRATRKRIQRSLSPDTPAVHQGPVRRGIHILFYLLRLAALVYRSLASVYWERGRGLRLLVKVTLQQIYFTAFQAMPVLLFVALSSGALVMIGASVQLPNFGMREVEGLAALVLLQGMAPMVVALVVIARSANSLVVEIGNMRLSGEMRSLEILGINLDRFIVLPRLAGMALSVVTLTVCFCAAALWGGFWLAYHSGQLQSDFVLSRLVSSVDLSMLSSILGRATFFGLIIGAVGCYHGLRVRVSPTEVTHQAGRGVVSSLSLCFVVNFLFLVEYE